MGSYFYVLAGLPFLEFESGRFPDLRDFLETCRLFLTDADQRVMESVKVEPETEGAWHPLLLRFWHWEIGLRNELARQRAELLGREAQIRLNDMGSDCTAIAGLRDSLKGIMQSESPLKVDEELDRLRWQYLDEIAAGQYFNLQQLIVYYLRLQILQRRQSLTSDSGREIYQDHYNNILSSIDGLQNGVRA